MSVAAYSAPDKSTGTAYLLWFFFGSLGAHKFYLRNPIAGGLYVAAWLAFWVMLASNAGLLASSLPLAALWICLTWDLFTLPGQVRAANAGGEAAVTGAPAAGTPLFMPKDEPFDEGAADAAIKRYLAVNGAASRSPGGRTSGSAAKPVFGRR